MLTVAVNAIDILCLCTTLILMLYSVEVLDKVEIEIPNRHLRF